VSTPTAARGFAVAERQAGRIASLADFPEALGELLEGAGASTLFQRQALAYAAQCLSWSAVTHPYRRRLHELLAAR
jgi:hypothetical protein